MSSVAGLGFVEGRGFVADEGTCVDGVVVVAPEAGSTPEAGLAAWVATPSPPIPADGFVSVCSGSSVADVAQAAAGSPVLVADVTGLSLATSVARAPCAAGSSVLVADVAAELSPLSPLALAPAEATPPEPPGPFLRAESRPASPA